MKRHGLLVGINEYQNPEIPPLKGCINDIEQAAMLLTTRFGFAPQDLTLLRNSEATRDAILGELARLQARTETDDLVVFYYSGHGSQMTDREGDEPDGLDETIVPHDSGRAPHPNRDITDDEIYSFLRTIAQRTSNITLIFDSCHSGGISRDALSRVRIRHIPADTRPPGELGADPPQISPEALRELREIADSPRKHRTSGWLPVSPRYTLLSGCRSEESSYEYETDQTDADGKIVGRVAYGAVSYFLGQALGKATAETTYQDLYESIAPRVNALFARQFPQIEGNVNRMVFGVADIAPLSQHVRIDRRNANLVTLAAGNAHGITRDSRWNVYPAGTKAVTLETPLLGKLVTISVDATTSQARIEQETTAGGVVAGSYAVESQHHYGEMLLNVRVDAPTHVAEAVNDMLARSAALRAVRDDETVDVTLHYRTEIASPCWAIADGADSLLAPVTVADTNAMSRLQENLEKIARFRFLRDLTNPNLERKSQIQGKISARLHRQSGDSPWIRVGDDEIPTYMVSDTEGKGDKIGITITNASEKPVYATVVDMDPTQSIQVLYPSGGMGVAIAPGGTLRLFMEENDKEVFLLDDFPYVVDPDAPAASRWIETFKVIVTGDQADFTFLNQSSVRAVAGGDRSDGDDPLLQLFDLANSGGDERLRGVRPAFAITKDWTTIEKPFYVQRQTGALQADGPVDLGAGVSVGPHPQLCADARIAEVAPHARDLGPVPTTLLGIGSPLRFGPSARALPGDPMAAPQTQPALELQNVSDYTVVTSDTPLRVTLDTDQTDLSPGETLLAYGWDGEFYLPLGAVTERRDHHAIVTLERLPQPTTIGQRDLIGSVKIYFQKVLQDRFGWESSFPRLDAPTLAEGKVVYRRIPTDVLRKRVAAASRIVVYVHGILGDTQGMALSAEPCGVAVTEASDGVGGNGGADLVLTFDYENLNTGIRETARSLKTKLAAIGLEPGHDKTAVLIAHSMGGLVSRWFVEREGGDAIVSRLITVGTPHAGSPWPRTVDLIFYTVGMALNGLGTHFWPAAAAGWLIGQIAHIDTMLDEMASQSEFLKALDDLAGKPASSVPYTIIAGDTSRIAPADGTDLGRREALFARLFSQRTAYQALGVLFGGSPNDIAVSITSGRAESLPAGWLVTRTVVPSDHLGYFLEPQTLALLRAAIAHQPAPEG